MASIEYIHDEGDEYVTERTHTDSQSSDAYGHIPYHVLSVSIADGTLANDDVETETVSISVVDGLEVARGTNPSNATVMKYNGDVTLSVDGQQTTKTLTNGSLSFDLSTDKPTGSDIEIVAESLADHPVESDSATIEVVSA